MIHFDMKTTQNFAHFLDKETGISVFVDSFDNVGFEVRVGTLRSSESLGTVSATDDAMLNHSLKTLVEEYLH